MRSPSRRGALDPAQIPGARLRVLPRIDHTPFIGDTGEVLAELESFVADIPAEEAVFDRALATVLFTDIVGSTERASATVDAVRTLDLEIRAGVHTGEVVFVGNEVRGIAVPIGARIGALAGPSEVLVSQTVRDLVAGSGLAFDDPRLHELKGVLDRWHVYRVVA